MNWSPDKCRPGDMIRVDLGALHHYGIFVDEDRVIQFGLPPVPENRRPGEVIAVTATDIDTFACGRIVEVAHFDRREKAKKFSADEIVSRAVSRLGETGYNLIHNNCEHFANECVFGEKRCLVEENARNLWNSRPMLDVYIAKADEKGFFETFFPPERRAETDAVSNENLKKLKNTAWSLLVFGLEKSMRLKADSLSFSKTKGGKWLCDKAYFSLSHTRDFVAVAVSNRPVGVDVLRNDDFYKKTVCNEESLSALCKKVYTRAELRNANGFGPDDFIEKWTRKEAVFKRRGKGKYRPDRIGASDANTDTYILQNPALLTVSVSGENVGKVRFYLFNDGKTTVLTPEKKGTDVTWKSQ